MRIKLIIVRAAASLVLLGSLSSATVYGNQGSPDDIRQLLLAMRGGHRSVQQLAKLFHVGDEKIDDLIKALDDPDKDVKSNAQIVIRYLGNDKGMKAWIETYEKRKSSIMTLPIPLPLRDWDYNFIRARYLVENPYTETIMNSYLFALALDGSSRAIMLFHQVIENAKKHGVELDESRYLQLARVSKIPAKEDLALGVLKNASFLNTQERRYATAKLIGYNGANDKALIEIYVNGGPLAEEWYHIIVNKCEDGWKFFSVSLIAWS
jgi:hypothetical protein